jgi:hypothetical protein
MTWKPTTPQAALRLAAAVILLVGWGSAWVIYLAADAVPEDPVLEQMQNSKMIRRDLQIYGGKMNLLSYDAGRWFSRHSHGQALWLPIAALSGLTALVLVVVADQT